MSKKILLCILAAVNLIIPTTGYFIGSAIQNSAKETQHLYESAKQTEDPKEFKTLCEQKDTPILAYGTLEPEDAITHPDLPDKEFIRLSLHTERYVTETDDEGDTDSDWETVKRDDWTCKKVLFLEQEFNTNAIRGISNNYYNTDRYYRFFEEYKSTWEGTTETTGTLFVSFKNGHTDTVQFHDCTISEAIKDSESRVGFILFWIIWICILAGIDIVLSHTSRTIYDNHRIS